MRCGGGYDTPRVTSLMLKRARSRRHGCVRCSAFIEGLRLADAAVVPLEADFTICDALNRRRRFDGVGGAGGWRRPTAYDELCWRCAARQWRRIGSRSSRLPMPRSKRMPSLASQ